MQTFYKINTIYRPFLFNFKFDYCSAMKQKNNNNKISEFFKSIFNSAKYILLPCPIKEGRDWCLKDFDTTTFETDSTIQYYLPEGDHKFIYTLIAKDNHTIAKTTCELNIKPRNGLDYEKFKLG